MCQTSCVCVVELTRTSLWSPTILTISVETRLYTGEAVGVVYFCNMLINVGDTVSLDPI